MTERISVFGLGYVGCVSAACLASEGHEVIGVDIKPAKVDTINRGETPIIEEGMADLIGQSVESGSLRATTEAREAVAASEISFVCVGTPGRPTGEIDLSAVRNVCEQIGRELRERDAKERKHLIVVRSTVLPGTIEEVVIPALERSSDTDRGDGWEVCLNPEFLREGTSIRDFHDPPFTLIGTGSDEAFDRLASLYRGIDAPVHRMEIRAAEMMKYACNSFHALKVSFANEIGNICKALEIDSHDVMEIFCEDRKLNISPAYLRPGFAFGGSCLPKDLRAITYRAKHMDVETPVLKATYESNRKQVERAARMVLDGDGRSIGILGLSFKEGTDDLRESPMVALVEILIGKGMELDIYDRNVSKGGVLGANKEFVERQIPHIWSLMRDSVEEVVRSSETLVLGNRSEEFDGFQEFQPPGQRVVDLARVFEGRVSDGDGYEGICW